MLQSHCLAKSIETPVVLSKGARRAFSRVREFGTQLWEHKVKSMLELNPNCILKKKGREALKKVLNTPFVSEGDATSQGFCLIHGRLSTALCSAFVRGS